MNRMFAEKSQTVGSPATAANDERCDLDGSRQGLGTTVSDDNSLPDATPYFTLGLLPDIQFWLDWQSRMISGVVQASVHLHHQPDHSDLQRVATWPENTVEFLEIDSLVQHCTASGEVVSNTGSVFGKEKVDVLLCPVTVNGIGAGAVSFVLHARPESQRDAVTQLVQWCVVWLQKRLTTAEASVSGSRSVVAQAVDLLAADGPLEVNGMQLCDYLAEIYSCTLVALGLADGLHVRTIAVSHQLVFDRRVTRITELEQAMEECLDQQQALHVPVPTAGGGSLTNAHNTVRENHNQCAVHSVPVKSHNSIVAVLIFIKDSGTPFENTRIRQLQAVAESLGPIVHLQRAVNQPLLHRAGRLLKRTAEKLTGREITRFKCLVGLCVLVPLLLAFVPATHRVSATAMLEGSLQQAIAAPVSGYVKSVHVRAGDSVTQGQILATLDDSELNIEVSKWQSEKDKLTKEYQQAWANRDKAQVTILASRLEQVETRLRLVEENLTHTKMEAPFDGMLISGDLSQQIGVPVERGQLLFEIVPLEGYKVILRVDEFDIGKVAKDQVGTLRLSSMPEELIEMRIASIFPLASNEQGSSFFRVEAYIPNPPDSLRPGMQGVAKVAIGRASVGSVWTRSLREKLSLYRWYLGF